MLLGKVEKKEKGRAPTEVQNSRREKLPLESTMAEQKHYQYLSATSSSQHEVPGVTTSDLGKSENDE